jgi:hypothetical protein
LEPIRSIALDGNRLLYLTDTWLCLVDLSDLGHIKPATRVYNGPVGYRYGIAAHNGLVIHDTETNVAFRDLNKFSLTDLPVILSDSPGVLSISGHYGITHYPGYSKFYVNVFDLTSPGDGIITYTNQLADSSFGPAQLYGGHMITPTGYYGLNVWQLW